MINSFSDRFRFLSNFYPCEINYEGIKYPSVEHFYVAQKIKDDQIVDGKFMPWIDIREYISKISSPGEVKRLGRKLQIRKDWDAIKLSIMEYGVNQKFKNEALQEMLISTRDEELIEGNSWHDNFFGSCQCSKCGNSGANNLGKILMKVRDGYTSKK